MAYSVDRLSPELSFGAVIRGLTMDQTADEAVRSELRRLWAQDGLLLFREGEISDEFQVALSKVFGPLGEHPVREVQSAANPDLIRITSLPGDSTVVEIDGEPGGAWLGWHSDMVYHHEINHGGMLRALQLTSRGGLTGFIDQIDAYDRLPQAMKARIEDLAVVYQLGLIDQFPLAYEGKVRLVGMARHSEAIMARIEADFPPVAHPLVFVQQETGRKVLNLSPMFARYIEDMRDPEGDALLADLAGHMLACPQYHHRWTFDDLLLWDNWRMLHSISPAPIDEPRVMQRTTIAGDYALGRRLDAEVMA
jgi:taurine dioxygenase